ncbi:OpgC domain-containing protein [Microvirga terrae]|uniref:OpgC domain-containing protein n=1 Tax=Microvirga terrae TaxID=2740529 RepID=A0ABY5RZW5_9HYPH|nr:MULTISPECIES: OpgC domain-containing protein [Microvirga]MBQ0819174.1 OpgC domain-containing protein [Microvirga sp. HBU67558]UVF21322.1 OpgC domain-containing protein [Microvirga terrae]
MHALRGRNTVIDFWRGLVLVIIFVNHVPGNILEHLTPRNYGFSDAAEAFVFISGLSVALVYYPKLAQSGIIGVVRRCVRRSFELYRMHLVMTGVAVALFSVGYVLSDDVGMLEAHGRGAVFDDTARGITGVLLLGHQLGYFNILPLYIALMLWAPVVMVLMRMNIVLAAAVSIGFYALARADILAIPSWPEPGRWFFNPFAWQLLFTMGIVTGAWLSEQGVPYWRPAFLGAVAFLAASLITMTNAFGLAPNLLWSAFVNIDIIKSDLGLGRLVHFLALAYVVTQLRFGEALQDTAFGVEMRRLGRNALPVFAVGSILSALGEVTMTLAAVKSSASPHVVGMVFTVFGILGLLLLARYLEWKKKGSPVPRQERTGEAGLLPAASGRLPQ